MNPIGADRLWGSIDANGAYDASDLADHIAVGTTPERNTQILGYRAVLLIVQGAVNLHIGLAAAGGAHPR